MENFRQVLDEFLTFERMEQGGYPVVGIAEWAGRARLGFELAKLAEQLNFEHDYPLSPRFAHGIGIETDQLESLIYLPKGFIELDRFYLKDDQGPEYKHGDRRFETLSGDDRSAYLTYANLLYDESTGTYKQGREKSPLVEQVIGIPEEEKVRRLIHDSHWRNNVRQYCVDLLELDEEILKMRKKKITSKFGAPLFTSLHSLIEFYREEMK